MLKQAEQLEKAVNELISNMESQLTSFKKLNEEIYTQAEAISRIVRQIKKEALDPPDQGNFKATP